MMLDKTFIKFIIVGICNTVVGTFIMFFAYNIIGLSYEISSVSNYVFGSILSYFLNKYFTFKATKKSGVEILLFIVNITICYLLAYTSSRFIISSIFHGQPQKWIDNIAMLVGMVLFVLLNYVGQRFIVFKKQS